MTAWIFAEYGWQLVAAQGGRPEEGESMRKLVPLLVAVMLVLAAGTAMAGGRPLSAALDADNEVPPSGTGATGSISITANVGQSEVCVTSLSTTGLSGPGLAMHIHKGDAETNGPVVVTLTGFLSGGVPGCVTADKADVKDILKNPSDYYVNLHTAARPGGEIRGQLDK